MTITLNLGINDIPYSGQPGSVRPVAKPKRGKANKPRKAPGSRTLPSTGDVAQILEDRYHIMEVFAESYMPHIVAAIEHSIGGAIESLAMGAPATINPFGSGMGEIEEGFRYFLDSSEMETMGIPGVPTMASVRGINHRLAHPYAKSNPPRPSFIDTGTYQANFRAWIETK